MAVGNIQTMGNFISKRISLKLKWWQLALISSAVSFLGSLSGGDIRRNDVRLYTKELKQAPWAPPAWLFAPAWTINNFFLLKALTAITEKQEHSKKRDLLQLQAAIWAIFFSFNYVYFKKKSTILAVAWTIADATLAWKSLLLARKEDKAIAANYLPLMAWTTFAATLAGYQALINKDRLLGTKALIS